MHLPRRPTNIAETVDIAADKAKYDSCAKKLLALKVVDAWILKYCVKEFYRYSIEYIINNCLPGEAEVSEHAVHQDQLNKSQRIDGDSKIILMNSESKSINEGTTYYDVRFTADVPDEEKSITLIINIEIQNDDHPGYELVTRGLYYCARMISEQHGTVFTGDDYGKIHSVRSIWICPDAAKSRQYSMFSYGIMENAVVGKSHVAKEAYELIEVMVLNLGDTDREPNNDILDFLSTLFSSTITSDKKKEILSKKYNIAMTADMESEVQSMCNLSDAIERRGIDKGIADEKHANIVAFLMRIPDIKMAADIFGVSEEEVRKIASEKGIIIG